MAAKATQRKHAILYSWVKWTPMLALVFAIVGMDAWLNIEKYNNDYLLWELGITIKNLDDARQDLRVANEGIINQEWAEKKAAELNMISLAPGQSRVITYTEDAAPTLLSALPHAMARWDAENMAIISHESALPITVARVEVPPETPLDISTPKSTVLEQIKTVVEHIAPVVPEQEEAGTEAEAEPEAEPVMIKIAAAAEPVVPVEVPLPIPVAAPIEEALPSPPVITVLDPVIAVDPIEALDPMEPVEVSLEILEPTVEENINIDESLDTLLSRI